MRRDDIPTIAWPGMIDLPGGGSDPGETPEACVIREIQEETGLLLTEERLEWRAPDWNARGLSWTFGARITETEIAGVRLGDEGQALWMMEFSAYLAAGDAIAHLKPRAEDAMRALGGG